jgi:hypothetical protein
MAGRIRFVESHQLKERKVRLRLQRIIQETLEIIPQLTDHVLLLTQTLSPPRRWTRDRMRMNKRMRKIPLLRKMRT